MEWKIQKPDRACVCCGRQFRGTDEFFSCLVEVASDLARKDYCPDCWRRERPECFSYWQGHVPPKEEKTPSIPSARRILELFDSLPPPELSQEPDATARIRYVLALLLMQKRILKLTDTIREEEHEDMLLDCSAYGRTYRVRVCEISKEDERKISDEIEKALEA